MKTPALVPLLLLCACNSQPTPITSSPPSPPPPVTTPAEKRGRPVPPDTAAYTGPVWRDKLNGNIYPLPDSIGGKSVSFYLANPQISPLAKALYTGRFRPTDTDSTTRLLDLVTTNDQALRPFYRWCLDFTIIISDGALGEYPGEPALTYATKFPQEFFAYMDKDKTGERYKRWVEIIAYSGLSNYEELAVNTQKILANSMTKQCHLCASETKTRIHIFAKDVATSYAQINN
ncbi:hypothetical protein J0X19_20090 [Hymenobacter sp. BT186]|uniref:Uncharacterized protein n=1 Tax=Hymenobacter telluris TaxID=2816474 RepID=A0A939F008_9BACT|nr:hypothetical protein [Hymenobacter telluris]MBO0360271.1 hypothetical protein [Hymenobacter telluris]MBW3376298.1 hypothetical protein [Hymenobacter norwichensis]